ncbi:hypothetical protein [Mesobacillus sp.]
MNQIEYQKKVIKEEYVQEQPVSETKNEKKDIIQFRLTRKNRYREPLK